MQWKTGIIKISIPQILYKTYGFNAIQIGSWPFKRKLCKTDRKKH